MDVDILGSHKTISDDVRERTIAKLGKLHGFTLPADRLRVAVNDEFEPWTAAVRDADSVVFIPPVAGG